MTEGLIIGYDSPAKEWLLRRGYMGKHPQSRAERMMLDAKKEQKKQKLRPRRGEQSNDEEENG